MRRKSEKGQAMVEFALILPIMLILIGGIIDFGWIFGNQIIANNACRESARYTAIRYNSIDYEESHSLDIVTQRGPTLNIDNFSVTESTTPSGDNITVAFDNIITVLTPIVSTFTGNTITIPTSSTMKLE